MSRFFLIGCLMAAVLPAFAGCNFRSGKGGGTAGPPTLPVAKPVEREVTDFLDYTGRTNAKDSVTIVPRVTGYLEDMPFKEGAEVKEGDVLFQIDPRPYDAQLKAAKAAVAQNIASLDYAKETNEQFKAIKKELKDAVTQRELNQYAALERQAIAALDFAEANLLSAELNLKWTVVKSPIDGHISRYYMTKGNLVNQDVTQLTTVVSINPIYVYFDMDEPTLIRLRRALTVGQVTPPRLTPAELPLLATSTFGLLSSPFRDADLLASSAALASPDAPVYIGLQGDKGYPYKGFVNFVDNQVNPGTGSISVRGVFENPRSGGKSGYLLTPGMFVRVHLPIGQPQKALLVVASAVASPQGKKQVFVVDAEKKVRVKPVTTGALQEDGLIVITSGLAKDDLVLVGGVQQAQDGMPVEPEILAQMPTPTTGEPSKVEQGGKKKSTK